jgi:hypothetical protein
MARKILGGNGILLENHVMRHMADMEALHTYEGTVEIQTLVVGRDITGTSAFMSRTRSGSGRSPTTRRAWVSRRRTGSPAASAGWRARRLAYQSPTRVRRLVLAATSPGP